MKIRLILTLLAATAVILFSAMGFAGTTAHKDLPKDHIALLIRSIGHHLLLQSGDSTSLVLPVQNTGAGMFTLEFLHAFSFSPDTLVKIVRHELAAGGVPSGFIVNVVECSSRAVVYGFEIGYSGSTLVPCSGRTEPHGCYQIQITFQQPPASNGLQGYYFVFAAVGLSVFALVGRSYFKSKGDNPVAHGLNVPAIPVGKYNLYTESRLLKFENEIIELSEKETMLLSILASRSNELVTRDELLKRVWEDQGVFTGRSLDMFISKLRKKLRNDPTVQLTNIHGRGYKLERL